MAKYRLNDIAPIMQGEVIKADQYWLLNLDMVESNTGRIIDYVYCKENEIGNSTIKFDTRNVLYSKLRPYLNKVVLPQQSGYATSEMLPLCPNQNIITREYLTYYLRSQSFVCYINEKTSGAKMPRANSSDLKSYMLNCPSLEDQKSITRQLDSIVAIIDKRVKELSKFDELIKARFVEIFGDPESDNKYPQIAVKDFTDVVSGGTPDRKNKEYWEEGTVPWVKTTELQNNRIIDVEEKITEKGLSESSAKMVPKDTILIAMYGQGKTRGMTAILGIPASTNQACACLLPSENVIPEYLWQFMIMSYDRLRNLAQGGNQPNLNGNMIKDFTVLMPPKEKQMDFVDFVKQVDKSKSVVQKSLRETKLLFDSLMQKYFG